MFRLALIFLPLFASAAFALTTEELHLSEEARGVLAHQCTKCHGQQKQKGELRLDTREGLHAGGAGGAVIIAGKPEESELLKRMRLPIKDDDHMPPEKEIDSPDIDTIRKWIAAGAPWPDGETAGIVFQRAPIAPRKPSFPAGTETFANPID